MKGKLIYIVAAIMALVLVTGASAATVATAWLNCNPGHDGNATFHVSSLSSTTGKVTYYNALTGGKWIKTAIGSPSYCPPAPRGCLLHVWGDGMAYPWYLQSITEYSTGTVFVTLKYCS